MRVLDLFSGIGGFSLGLERAGMRTVAFCEVEPYCRAVLAERWPGVPIYADVRELSAARIAADGISVDVICGGFPCQDISIAGNRVGLEGKRSGLWSEYARLVGELRPSYAIVENVAALLGWGMARVVGDLAELGYDAEWSVISACALGAPHSRERVFLIAYPNGARRENGFHHQFRDAIQTVRTHWQATQDKRQWDDLERWLRAHFQDRHGQDDTSTIFGVDDGLSESLDAPRVHALGNAIVPQIPEIIGRAIMSAATDRRNAGT